MPQVPPSRPRVVLADLDEAITRAELQVSLLAMAVAIRVAAGRGYKGLHVLIDGTEARIVLLERERRRVLEKR